MTFPSLLTRHREPEWMDQPDLDPQLHREALRGLRRVNRLSRTVARLWKPIAQLARRLGRPLRVLDLASGGGDVAIGIALQARRDNLPIVVEGCDASVVAVKHAASAARYAKVDSTRFFRADVLVDPLPQGYDVTTCSLFLHHIEDFRALTLLRNMKAASRELLLVDDLLRSRLGYALAWLSGRLLSRSPIVHCDGPRSVAGAYSVAEASRLADAAGLDRHCIARHWPQRYLLSWKPT